MLSQHPSSSFDTYFERLFVCSKDRMLDRTLIQFSFAIFLSGAHYLYYKNDSTDMKEGTLAEQMAQAEGSVKRC